MVWGGRRAESRQEDDVELSAVVWCGLAWRGVGNPQHSALSKKLSTGKTATASPAEC